MKRNWMILLAGLLATGLIAAGCGGDDDDDDGGDGGEALSKEEFVSQANQICTDGNAEVETAATETFQNGQPTPEEEEAFVTDTVLPSVQGQIDQIRALGIPEGDEDEVNGFLDEAEAIVDEAEADPQTFFQGDPFAEVNDDLTAYGLTACAAG
jgi:hypothetical protein